MKHEKERRGCWRCGCFGCLGLAVVGLLMFVLLGVSQSIRQSRDAVVEDVNTDVALPSEEQFEQWRKSGELGARSRFPLGSGDVTPAAPAPMAIGRVRLDLELGDFEIRRGLPGEGVRVEGNYEPDAFRLTESLEEGEDGNWSYRLSLEPRGGLVGLLVRGGGNNPSNQLKIYLPPDVPFDLSGNWGIGEFDADLGGLWLREVDLEMGAGEHVIRFSEPTLTSLEDFRVDKSVGELVVDQLGNASPARARIEQRIGELRVDLEGDWIGDADLDISQSMGEIDIDSPSTARIEPQGSGVLIGERQMDLEAGEALPPDAPTLRLRASGSVGEIRIDPPRQPAEPTDSGAMPTPPAADSPML